MTNLVLVILTKNYHSNVTQIHKRVDIETTTITNQLSRVIGSLRCGLRTRKVCITRRPWMDTFATLFHFVKLDCCFNVLWLFYAYMDIWIIVRLLLPYVRGMVWIVIVALPICYTQHVYMHFITIINTRTRAFV